MFKLTIQIYPDLLVEFAQVQPNSCAILAKLHLNSSLDHEWLEEIGVRDEDIRDLTAREDLKKDINPEKQDHGVPGLPKGIPEGRAWDL